MKFRSRNLFATLGFAAVLVTASCVPPGGGGVAAPAPGAPINMTVSAAGPPATGGYTVHVKWTEAASAVPITGWLVTRNGGTFGGPEVSAILPVSASQYKFTGLRAYSFYEVTVRAISASGFGHASALDAYTGYGQGTGVACSNPAALGYYPGPVFNVVCDGFRWVGAGQIAAWNATGVRSATGMFVSASVECVNNGSTRRLNVIGSLSQLGLPGHTLSTENTLPCVGAPVRVTEWVKGHYAVGRASLVVYGDSGGGTLASLSDDIIAVNVLR